VKSLSTTPLRGFSQEEQVSQSFVVSYWWNAGWTKLKKEQQISLVLKVLRLLFSSVQLCFSLATVAVPPFRHSPSHSSPHPRVPQFCSRLASHWGNCSLSTNWHDSVCSAWIWWQPPI